MTQLKKLKKAIRSRSRKTGESYAAARRQVLKARRKGSTLPGVAAAPRGPLPPARSGISEAAVVKKTGHGLDYWFAALDAFGAPAKGHTASATHLYEALGVPGWHAQMISVAYEHARGLRGVNQTCAGDFQVSVSRVVPASVPEVAEAFRDAGRRAAWLRGAEAGLARALGAAFKGAKAKEIKTKGKGYAWFSFPWNGSRVEIRITGKANGSASVVADNIKLADAALVEERRALWKAALAGLKGHLTA